MKLKPELQAAVSRVVGVLTGESESNTLRVDVTESGFRIEYDPKVFDPGLTERFPGYVRRALAGEADLLSPEERRHLLHERGGEVRELPRERFHEIFARRAAEHPDRVAVVHSGQSYSYSWLNGTANRVAHSLLAQGVRPEDVVMTLTERTPHWLAAIIGIVKAGCAYLPAEPDFPQARIDTLREQSGCRIVLTAADLSNLDSYSDADPSVEVGLDQLAYIYFTSGSTGKPKGAMCTHHGMINHLTAKVIDFEIDESSVVVQNAQQTFDISLWQLIAPLFVGGQTLILTRDEILDVRRFFAACCGWPRATSTWVGCVMSARQARR